MLGKYAITERRPEAQDEDNNFILSYFLILVSSTPTLAAPGLGLECDHSASATQSAGITAVCHRVTGPSHGFPIQSQPCQNLPVRTTVRLDRVRV